MVSPGPVGNLSPVLGQRCDGPAGRGELGSRRTRWSPRLGGGARRSGHVTQDRGKVMLDHLERSKARDT